MPNTIKYNASTEARALKKGNFWLGTGDVDKGPTSTTGFWNGITPPAGGYTVYVNKASQGPSIHVTSNDSELIALTNRIAGASYTTVNECLNYFNTQVDKICVNRDYESIITDGLILNVDLGFTPSYPKNGVNLYDTSSESNDMTIYGSPAFTSEYLTFTSNQITKYTIKNPFPFPADDISMECWVKFGTTSLTGAIFSYASSGGNNDGLLFLNSGSLLFYGPGNASSPASWSIPDTTSWYHIVRTRLKTSGEEKLYVNGNLISTFVMAAGTSFTTGGSLVIGQEQDTTGGSFDAGQCFIGDFSIGRIYNKKLSADEVLQNFNSQKDRFGR